MHHIIILKKSLEILEIHIIHDDYDDYDAHHAIFFLRMPPPTPSPHRLLSL